MAIYLSKLCALKYEKKLRPQPSINHPRPRVRINAVSSTSARELIQTGTVRSVSGKEVISAMRDEGYILLDIRPIWERGKAYVPGSLHVPLFIKDIDNSPLTLLKKWVHFGYIGLWTGQHLTTIDSNFLSLVETSVPDKEAKLLVVCGEGLRSLMAITRLHVGGYRNLGWLVGGFNRAEDNDFPAVEGTSKLQYATIGGVSYYFLQILILLQAVGKKGR